MRIENNRKMRKNIFFNLMNMLGAVAVVIIAFPSLLKHEIPTDQYIEIFILVVIACILLILSLILLIKNIKKYFG